MNLLIVCKLSAIDAYYNLKPITYIPYVSKIYIARDKVMKSDEKFEFIGNKVFRSRFFSYIYKLLKIRKVDAEICIGIYEIPHGYMAYLAALFSNKKFGLNLISNPGYKPIRRGLRLFVLKYLIKKAKAVGVTGNYSINYLVKHFNINRKKIFIIPNSIDVKDYRFVDHNKIYDVISLGRFDPEKGYLTFVKVIKKLTVFIQDINVAIAGEGPCFQETNKLIKELDLEENIHLLGFIENPEQFYQSGKIFLTTTRTEGMPRSVIQSLSCGIPCVASNVGDMTDVVIDGVTGYLVEDYNDIDDYCTKVLKLLDSESLLKKLGDNGIKHVIDNFSIEASVKNWSDLISYLRLN